MTKFTPRVLLLLLVTILSFVAFAPSASATSIADDLDPQQAHFADNDFDEFTYQGNYDNLVCNNKKELVFNLEQLAHFIKGDCVTWTPRAGCVCTCGPAPGCSCAPSCMKRCNRCVDGMVILSLVKNLRILNNAYANQTDYKYDGSDGFEKPDCMAE